MARKKSISDQQILDMAYQIVIDSGFKGFTARNIARHLNCSTQPIYLEFNSMGELKQAVLMRLRKDLKTKMGKRYTDDPIIDLGLAFVDFATQDRALYQAVFTQNHFGADAVTSFIEELGLTCMADYAPAATLSAAQQRGVLKGLWIVATGMANLTASGFMALSVAQRGEMLQAVVGDFIANRRFEEAEVDQTIAM